jgi:long-chain acyl-CoA synthetase
MAALWELTDMADSIDPSGDSAEIPATSRIRPGYESSLWPQEVDWHADLPQRPLPGLLDDAVARFSDRPACDFLDRKFTYGEIGRLTDRFAKGLQQAGVAKGDRVGLFLPNTPYSIVAFFAVQKIGGVVVNFNPLYAEREIAKQIEDAGVDLMITLDLAILHDKLLRMLSETRLNRVILCKMTGILSAPKKWLYPFVKSRDIAKAPRDDRHLRFDDLIDNDGRFDRVSIGPDDLAVLQYTGGTTGVPKGAMLTHGNLTANIAQSRLWFVHARPGEEVALGVLPFFHVFAMTVIMGLSIEIGAEIILLPRFELDTVMKTIDKKKPTLFPAVPTIYTAVANHPELSKYDITSIRMCISGGAPLPVEVKQKFEQLTGATVTEGYGLTESSPVACCNPFTSTNKAGSIGLPLPGTTIEIVSLEDRSRMLGVGERGEVTIRGPQVMKGYWNQPEETANTLVNGRLHTGDVGLIDSDGYVYIVDRIKDLILAGGFNIYPRNVEEALYLHPGVAECVVAGVEDSYRGQTVKAYIKLSPDHRNTRPEDLKAFLKDKLSPIEIPKQWEFRDELPKTMIGKLSRKALLDEEAERRAAEAQAGAGG